MPKVTSKLQLTIPKAIAERYRIRQGDHVDLQPAGEAIRMVPRSRSTSALDPRERLRLFDRATKRQRAREENLPKAKAAARRGWVREDLYKRGGAR